MDKEEKCNNNLANCFCSEEIKHDGLHKCRCGGSWDEKKNPHSFPRIDLGFGMFPNTEKEKEILLNKKGK